MKAVKPSTTALLLLQMDGYNIQPSPSRNQRKVVRGSMHKRLASPPPFARKGFDNSTSECHQANFVLH